MNLIIFPFFSCTQHQISPDIPQATLQTTLPPTTTTMITTTSVHRNENMIGKHLIYEIESCGEKFHSFLCACQIFIL